MTECINRKDVSSDPFLKCLMLPPSPPIMNHIFHDEVDEIDYRFEIARLSSFKNWPCPYLQPERLATAGFYYTGVNDKVRCFECRAEISQWSAEDDPMVDHQRWSGRCRFIRNIPCGNVPIGVDPDTVQPPLPRGRDVCGPYSSLEYCSNMNPNGLLNNTQNSTRNGSEGHCNNPRHPQFASYEARLRTFETWPIAISQTKEQLAHAGFYYTGNSDQTLCYYCGGGLKDWEPEDEPWEQHAKWFHKCPYLITTKGQDYINRYTGKSYDKQESLESVSSEQSEKSDDVCPGPSFSQNSVGSMDSGIESIGSCPGSSEMNVEQLAYIKSHPGKPIDDARMCKICYNRELRKVFVPCGHLVACAECAKNMKTCAVCRKPVMDTVQAFIS